MAANPLPLKWDRKVIPSMLDDARLHFTVGQLERWGLNLRDMKWLSPTVRLRYRKSGAPHSLSGDIQLNTISDIDKGGKYSMPAKDVRSLLSAFGAELNGTFYFACTGRHGNVLSLDVTYTPPKPAAPASRSPPPAAGGNTTTRSPANASKAAAASAPGYMQAGSAAAAGQPPRGAAAAGRPSRPSASAVDLCSEDDEPLIYRVHARHARAAKRPAPTPAAAAGSPAKQARLTGSSAHKAAGQPAPTTPAGAGAAAAEAAAAGSPEEQQAPAPLPTAGGQLGASVVTAIQQKTAAVTAAAEEKLAATIATAVREQLAAQLPGLKADLVRQLVAEAQKQVAEEVRRQVAKEVRRQVDAAMKQVHQDFTDAVGRLTG